MLTVAEEPVVYGLAVAEEGPELVESTGVEVPDLNSARRLKSQRHLLWPWEQSRYMSLTLPHCLQIPLAIVLVGWLFIWWVDGERFLPIGVWRMDKLRQKVGGKLAFIEKAGLAER